MSLAPQFGAPMGAPNLSVLSRALLDFDAADLVWSPDTGAIVDASGHEGTFTRGATLASVLDANGATYTAQHAQIAFEQRTMNGVEALCVRMGTADRFVFPTNVRPQAMCGLVEIVETGARTSANATLFALRNDAASGAGVWLDTSGTYYRFNYSDGSTTRTATLTSGQPVSGNAVQFVWDITDLGVLTLRQYINAGAPTSATAAALALPGSWASGAAWRINRRGSSANPAQGAFRRARVLAGPLDFDRLLARR